MKRWWESGIAAPDIDQSERALARQMQLTKPPGSLGKLESIAVELCAMQGQEFPQINRPAITIFAADHGVAEEGVSAFPQSVTVEMVRNFSRGGAAISVLAQTNGAALEVVNVGTLEEIELLDGVLDCRIAAGSANFCKQPAMDHEQLDRALSIGREAAGRALDRGADLFIGGEMGIANTTAASALAAALLGVEAAAVVGRGTGLNDEGVELKERVVERALVQHDLNPKQPLEILGALGGLEIAALCGSYLAAAQQRMPILVDGFIASVAALVAIRLTPQVRSWMLFSHRSAEQGHKMVLDALDADPLLDLGMRLGEGSGAAVSLPLLHQACALHQGMATFSEAGVSEG